ncbi:hypothetical protein NQ317_005057 [Molorchus minor]|uniref:39S ribosomal protein L18, mitochondrial n=1 Tax=Molorchus minor TaxID=1323400 RepID=A0ABQ9JW91_9CUCU|nr:hypothetical protein NQ317_005057 [Molorchus minor]
MLSFKVRAQVANGLKNCRAVSASPSNSEISPIFTNRNPRNLEKLRIGYKPDGFHVDKPGKTYWHKLKIKASGRYVSAWINHFENGEVVKASTLEWAIKKQLYKPLDVSAYINLGRVLAERCVQSGILEVSCNVTPAKPDTKLALFLKAVEEGGVKLSEPEQYKPSRPWDQFRPEKPWEVVD